MNQLSKFLVAATLAFVGCASDAEPQPVVVESEVQTCGPAARLVEDVCTQLGGDDGCVAVDDVCIALCDERPSCETVSPTLRVLDPWPVAPDGYCVVCSDPQ